jgi:hypothetical protein
MVRLHRKTMELWVRFDVAVKISSGEEQKNGDTVHSNN